MPDDIEVDPIDWPEPEAEPIEYGYICKTCHLSDFGVERLRSFGFTIHPCRDCKTHFDPDPTVHLTCTCPDPEAPPSARAEDCPIHGIEFEPERTTR